MVIPININLIYFITIFVCAQCVDEKRLKAQYPVYGLSSLVDRNSSDDNNDCFRQLSEFKDAVDIGKAWGLKVLDASGQPPPGFLYGNNIWIGSHTQCIDIQNRKQFEIRVEKANRTDTPFEYPPYELGFASVMMRHNSTMQYHMRLPLDYTVQLGLCVPKSCTQREIFDLSERYFSNDSLAFQHEYQISLSVDQVRILEESGLWMLMLTKTYVFLIVVTIIFLLTVIGTTYDVKQHNREKNLIRGHNSGIIGKVESTGGLRSVELISSSNQTLSDIKQPGVCVEILKCFSFYSNVKKWSKTKVSPDSLPIIHGVRFLAMGWVIIVHTSFFQGDFTQNPPYAWRLTENFMAQIVSNSTYCVDTYLFLSGFLLAFLFFKSINPHEVIKRPVSYISNLKKFVYMYLNRFLRLTPTYAIVILLCNLIYTFYSKKSSLYFSERPDIACDNYWWRNVLYVNNLYPRSEMCLSWSWYLSVDMQFFTYGAFLLLLSTICFNMAAVLVVLTILIQVAVTAYKSYTIGYIPTLDDQLEQLDAIYDLPWNRIGPYMVGIITAYILVIKLKNKLILKERTRLTLWVVFPLLNLWILFTLYTRQVSVEFSAFYMAVSRTLWGVGIGWFVVAVSTGNARLLEKILSFSAWVPLGRLTYCAYLLNPLVVTMIALGSESGIVMSIPEMGIAANGTVMITFLIAFLFSMLFESPFIRLTKLIFKQSNKSASEQPTSEAEARNHSSSTISTLA